MRGKTNKQGKHAQGEVTHKNNNMSSKTTRKFGHTTINCIFKLQMDPPSSPMVIIRRKCRPIVIESDSESEVRCMTPEMEKQPVEEVDEPIPSMPSRQDSREVQLPGEVAEPKSSTPCKPGTSLNTHCKQYEDSGFASFSSKANNGEEHVIRFQHLNKDPWDSQSEEDSLLNTSTPAYKRGEHPESQEDKATHQARAKILKNGVKFDIPRWMTRARPESIQLLTDDQLAEWLIGDRYCKMVYYQHLSLAQWIPN